MASQSSLISTRNEMLSSNGTISDEIKMSLFRNRISDKENFSKENWEQVGPDSDEEDEYDQHLIKTNLGNLVLIESNQYSLLNQ